ncbi:YkgJ family cysteine cluster protein [Geomonas subterranea]|uniref:YkgJ family cysteine cluster protein n=1 Tax=Geomonas subterranea TaxID=2847989 RepID=A0ABX8LM81_9BACT|nr:MULTISPECIES: YkgJ family cysteine cluster protein [Geomonas]QXE91825.1 YkgJ family cysteine cluster protein [Geomonas subterranea]QXM10082.1 YkgJ family cysteine cluster protein [Geomonas subterranea]
MEEILKRNRELLARVDDWFARCMAAYPEHIACRSGCSGCCRSTFDITLLDAYYLKLGFDRLPEAVRVPVLAKCRERLALMRQEWPEFDHPFVLNYRPEEEWELLMPDLDETPCVLLGDDGRCLVYDHRPMTCRLHGIPLVDTEGEVMHDEWCTMNFTEADPLTLPGLTAPFDSILRAEVALFRDFTERFLGRRMSELDTLIPTALMIDFDGFDWKRWAREEG